MSTVKLREDLKAAKDRAYSLKTKKAKEKAWTKVREIEREICHVLYDAAKAFERHSVKGEVVSFHDGEDYVAIRTAEYGLIWANQTSDVVSKSWYGSTCCVEYTVGQTVVVEIDIEVNSEKLFLEVVPKTVVGGKLNEAKYSELCKRDNLAFFKYPELKGGMTGLFASPKAVSNE